jgi:protease-4
VRIDSPGGTVVGGESLYRNLRKVAESKPVVATIGQMGTSAGYMTALGADHIVARSGTLTGSIGVILQTADVTSLLEKLGVKPQTIKSRPLKAQPNPFEPMTDEVREATRAVVLDTFELFVDLVAESRQMPRDRVLELADGRMFTGRQARVAGLVDELGGEGEARRWLEETHAIAADLPVRDVSIDYDSDIWRDLVQKALGKALFSERLRLDGLISVWHPEL